MNEGDDARELAAARSAEAQRLAARLPFLHFPLGVQLVEVAGWGQLLSAAARHLLPAREGAAAAIRHEHVFAYAGPSCYGDPEAEGSVLLVFAGRSDARPGAICRFDSGALLEPKRCLQPMASAVDAGTTSEDDALRFVERCSLPLDGFRDALGAWLAASYDRPERYLEAGEDRYVDGEPDRLEPPELLEHNGGRGRAASARRCADRRAWTWEARFEESLPFTELAMVVVPDHLLREAYRAFDALGTKVAIEPLPAGWDAKGESFYRYSATLLSTWNEASP